MGPAIRALAGTGMLAVSAGLFGAAWAEDGYRSLTPDQIDRDAQEALLSQGLSAAAQLFPVGGYDGWFLTGTSRIVSEGSGGSTDESQIHLAGRIAPDVVLALSVVFAKANTLTADEYGTLAVEATKFWRSPESREVRPVPPGSVPAVEERAICGE